MDTTDNKKTIVIKQGIGEDALEMTVQVTNEELEKMEHLRQITPSIWEGKDLGLLQEARKLIKEQENNYTTIETTTAANDNKMNEELHDRAGLWWALGIFCGLLLTLLIGHSIMEKNSKEATEYILSSNMSNITKTLNYKFIRFDYKSNWSFSATELAEGIYLVGGQNEQNSEFGIFLVTNQESPSIFIDNIITGYATSPKFSDVSYSAIYDTHINDTDAIAVDYSYVDKNRRYYAKVIGFAKNGNTIVINPVALSKEALFGDDIILMENSLKCIN